MFTDFKLSFRKRGGREIKEKHSADEVNVKVEEDEDAEPSFRYEVITPTFDFELIESPAEGRQPQDTDEDKKPTSLRTNTKRQYKPRRTRTEPNALQCWVCDFVGSQPFCLETHLMRRHGIGDMPFHKCEQCDYKTIQLYHLKRHMLVHSGEKPYKCVACDYTATQKALLQLHMKSRHGTESSDPHLMNGIGDKPLHMCEQCNYMSTKSSHLKRHMLLHTGEKPYKCGLCDYSARQKRCVQLHMKKWHGTGTGVDVEEEEDIL